MSLKVAGLVAVCPHCGETIEITVTKKQAKALLKAFKTSRTEGLKGFERASMESQNRTATAQTICERCPF
jgi:hypothetical protein